jgi:hypothetical protein
VPHIPQRLTLNEATTRAYHDAVNQLTKRETTTMNFQVLCKCGWRAEPVADRKRAEVIADTHETSARHAHKHDTSIFEVLDVPTVRVIDTNFVEVR